MSKIAIIKELLDSADKNIQQARGMISDITGDIRSVDVSSFSAQAEASGASKYVSEGGDRIVEGVFNGQEMIDSEGNTYPVPVNYASKSKLVSGDKMKLTIQADGRFLYKQIGPAPRKYVVGPLSYEDGQYKVLTNGVAYKVLLASVTYFKAEIGDEVSVVIPDGQESEWAAIDAVLPKYDNIADADALKEEA